MPLGITFEKDYDALYRILQYYVVVTISVFRAGLQEDGLKIILEPKFLCYMVCN